MPNKSKFVLSGSNNIFLQNSFSLVLQFPFENPTTVENFKQLLANRDLELRKMSKSALHRQLAQINVDFVPTFGANFLLVHKNPEEILPSAQINELFSLIKQHQANVLFLKSKENKNKKAFWYDSKRLQEYSALAEQPPFSSHLYQILRSNTIFPLLTNSIIPLLRVLEREK